MAINIHKLIITDFISCSFMLFPGYHSANDEKKPTTYELAMAEAFTQDDKIKNWSFKGNVKNLQNIWIEDFNEDWLSWSIINNRIDFKWYPNDNLTASFGVRNQFMYGQLIQLYSSEYPENLSDLNKEKGFFDLTHVFS